jgi:hypothetical protein
MTPTILDALDDPDLFGDMFNAPSWRPWRVFLAALFGLPMDDDALALFRHHTARTAPPAKPSRYAELVIGRRGGKSRVLGLLAVYLACCIDHTPYLVPGETPVVGIFAKDRDQSRVILGYIVGFLRAVPLFAGMIEDELAETVRLSNGVMVEVHTASIGAPRGRTYLAVLADETAFWPTGDSANPDVEVINAVRPGLSTIPYSLLIVASSPYARRGILYTNFSRYFGKDDAPVLVWQGTTQEMNSNLIGDALIEEMYREDPDRASAEFGAQFRSDIVAFITREAVESVVASGIRELPPGGGIVYAGFGDPSGGSADSFTIAIAHVEADGTAVLDCVREARPPFSPDGVVQEYAALLKTYGITRITGDAYAGEWPRERFAVHGIRYEVSKRNKSTIYAEFLPALNGQRVRLLDLPRLISQLSTLERRTARGGRDSIDHEPGAHDDVANSVCGVLTQIIEDRRPALIKQNDLLVNEKPAEHRAPSAFSAVVWVATTGICAMVYFSHVLHGQPALIVEDFDVLPWSGDVLPAVATRLDELCEAAAERSVVSRQNGVGALLHVPRQLHSAGCAAMRRAFAARMDRPDIRHRLLSVFAIEEELIAEPEQLVLNASAHVTAGAVKLSATAMARSDTQPFLGSLSLMPGETVTGDPLRMAALLGIAGLDWAHDRTARRSGAAVRFG